MAIFRAIVAQEACLHFGLDAFSDLRQSQRLGRVDDVEVDLASCCIGAYCVNEAVLDLQVFGLELGQVRQTGKARAEIIDYQQTTGNRDLERDAIAHSINIAG